MQNAASVIDNLNMFSVYGGYHENFKKIGNTWWSYDDKLSGLFLDHPVCIAEREFGQLKVKVDELSQYESSAVGVIF